MELTATEAVTLTEALTLTEAVTLTDVQEHWTGVGHV